MRIIGLMVGAVAAAARAISSSSMPAYVKHHFVPKFHLRDFGIGKSIAAYLLRERRFLRSIPIADQCQKTRLYGSIAMEQKLDSIENAAAPVIRKLCKDHEMPSTQSPEMAALHAFLVFQVFRTPSAGELVRREWLGRLEPHSALHEASTGQSVKVEMDNPVYASMWYAMYRHWKMVDLEVRLLSNNTSIDLLTSDSPAIVKNWIFPTRAKGVPQLDAVGTVFLLPLNPRKALLLHDASAYETSEPLNIDLRERDVTLLNEMQLHGADNIIFFRAAEGTQRHVERLHTLASEVEREMPSFLSTREGNWSTPTRDIQARMHDEMIKETLKQVPLPKTWF